MNQQEFHRRYEEESDRTYNALMELDEDEIFMGKVQYGRDENREAVDQPAAIKKLAEMLEDLRYPLFPPIPK